MKEKVLKICEEICCTEISMKDSLITTGLVDSYRILEIVNCLEEEFNVVFSPKDITNLANFSCVEAIADCIQKYKRME